MQNTAVQNVVISLATATDRRDHIKQEFGTQNIAFAFFDAITPDLIDGAAQHLNIDLSTPVLSAGEKGCFLSHAMLWQQMIANDIAYMAIFEDDIYLGESASLLLNHNAWLKNLSAQQPIDFIKLELFDNQRILHTKKIAAPDGRMLQQLLEQHVGTAGYLLSQNAASHLLAFLRKKPPTLPIDDLIFDIFKSAQNTITLYQLCPALCVQSTRIAPNQLSIARDQNPSLFFSGLDTERILLRSKKSTGLMAILHKIKLEILRPYKRRKERTKKAIPKTTIDFR